MMKDIRDNLTQQQQVFHSYISLLTILSYWSRRDTLSMSCLGSSRDRDIPVFHAFRHTRTAYAVPAIGTI